MLLLSFALLKLNTQGWQRMLVSSHLGTGHSLSYNQCSRRAPPGVTAAVKLLDVEGGRAGYEVTQQGVNPFIHVLQAGPHLFARNSKLAFPHKSMM